MVQVAANCKLGLPGTATPIKKLSPQSGGRRRICNFQFRIKTMNATELQALRRLLFLNVPEAAAMVSGTSERAWKHWESGQRAVPADVASRLRELAAWRENVIDTTLDHIHDTIDRLGPPESIPLVWYANMHDWLGEPVMWRPHQSACAELVSVNALVRLVPFDSTAYATWLGDKADSSPQRAAWAAQANKTSG